MSKAMVVVVVVVVMCVAAAPLSLATTTSVTMVWNWSQLDWPNQRTPTHFFIYRQNRCVGAFIQIGSVTWPTQQFIDSRIEAGVLYCWLVTTYDGVVYEESIPSNVVSFQTVP